MFNSSINYLTHQLLMKFDPEVAHNLFMHTAENFPSLSKQFKLYKKPQIDMTVKAKNLTWPAPLGLAAGFDKNAQALSFLSQLGFGSIEAGTVTLNPQAGNPKPRIHRLKTEASLRNSMGFPNVGLEKFLVNLQKQQVDSLSLGINIGPNKELGFEEILQQLETLIQSVQEKANFVTVNLSSPNTQGLRQLQSTDFLKEIIDRLKPLAHKPMFIKIAPNLTLHEVQEICELVATENLAGVIATNTTNNHQLGAGGLSGEMLKKEATVVRAKALEVLSETNCDVIGVGGISTLSDLKEFYAQGGKLAQVYTSFIYQGPELINKLYSKMEKEVLEQGFSQLDEWIDSLKKA